MLSSSSSSPQDLVKLDSLISLFEENLRAESFYIAQKDIPSLLELLPRQEEILAALHPLWDGLKGNVSVAPRLLQRFEKLTSLRAQNEDALQQLLDNVKVELGDVNSALRRILQLRQKSKGLYKEGGSSSSSTRIWA